MGERDKQNKHAYDKKSQQTKKERENTVAQRKALDKLLQFLRKCLKSYRYGHTNKKQYIFGIMFSALFLHI